MRCTHHDGLVHPTYVGEDHDKASTEIDAAAECKNSLEPPTFASPSKKKNTTGISPSTDIINMMKQPVLSTCLLFRSHLCPWPQHILLIGDLTPTFQTAYMPGLIYDRPDSVATKAQVVDHNRTVTGELQLGDPGNDSNTVFLPMVAARSCFDTGTLECTCCNISLPGVFP